MKIIIECEEIEHFRTIVLHNLRNDDPISLDDKEANEIVTKVFNDLNLHFSHNDDNHGYDDIIINAYVEIIETIIKSLIKIFGVKLSGHYTYTPFEIESIEVLSKGKEVLLELKDAV